MWHAKHCDLSQGDYNSDSVCTMLSAGGGGTDDDNFDDHPAVELQREIARRQLEDERKAAAKKAASLSGGESNKAAPPGDGDGRGAGLVGSKVASHRAVPLGGGDGRGAATGGTGRLGDDDRNAGAPAGAGSGDSARKPTTKGASARDLSSATVAMGSYESPAALLGPLGLER